jgi:CRP-like cAMP-binding protein
MSIEDDISFLECVPTLTLLGRPALRILAIGAQSRYVHGGEVLFRQGEEADGAFIVQEGRLKLAPAAGNDSKATIIGRHSLIGEVALITPCKRAATAVALEPSNVLFIPRPLFLKMLDSFPETARKLRDTMAVRVSQSAREISNMRHVLDTYQRK